MAGTAAPEARWGHESALIDDVLHLYGGRNEEKWWAGPRFFPRNEIWVCNVRSEKKKWIRRLAQGKNIPPPCQGARCVVINGIIYSYGGRKEDRSLLGDVFGLHPKEMTWFQVATPPTYERKPMKREACCLWAIGGKIVMFGGAAGVIPQPFLQPGASCQSGLNNEIFQFVFEGDGETGSWLDVILTGKRPQPLCSSAGETIDESRGLLHGGYSGSGKYVDEAYVIDLKEKIWIFIEFSPKPSSRNDHRICQFRKSGVQEGSCFLLVGGYNRDNMFSDNCYILDLNERKSYMFYLNPRMVPIQLHTLHCDARPDGYAQIIMTGGRDWNQQLKSILYSVTIGLLNEPFIIAESEHLPIASLLLESQRQRNYTSELEREVEQLRLENMKIREKDNDKSQLEEKCQSLEREIEICRDQCHALQEEKIEATRALENETETLEALLKEAKQNLDQFINVLAIRPDQVNLTEQKLGSGAYADVIIGCWQGMSVAVKTFHTLITTPRTIPTFWREVVTASRLHHPNIIRVCGAVMQEEIPFQIVSELLEGSMSEVIDAAHAAGRKGGVLPYLSSYEQLSTVVQMTSAIAYLHDLKPRPYVHGDVRSTNMLVTRDMKVKVADLGAAHLVESSKSAGPLSPQYLAPERNPPTSGRSSLPSDVYSLGVTLIEVFTGVGPISEERISQLSRIRNRRHLYKICSRMILGESEIEYRPRSAECLDVLRKEMEEIVENGSLAVKRMVKGSFGGEGVNRHHKVSLSDSFHY